MSPRHYQFLILISLIGFVQSVSNEYEGKSWRELKQIFEDNSFAVTSPKEVAELLEYSAKVIEKLESINATELVDARTYRRNLAELIKLRKIGEMHCGDDIFAKIKRKLRSHKQNMKAVWYLLDTETTQFDACKDIYEGNLHAAISKITDENKLLIEQLSRMIEEALKVNIKDKKSTDPRICLAEATIKFIRAQNRVIESSQEESMIEFTYKRVVNDLCSEVYEALIGVMTPFEDLNNPLLLKEVDELSLDWIKLFKVVKTLKNLDKYIQDDIMYELERESNEREIN